MGSADPLKISHSSTKSQTIGCRIGSMLVSCALLAAAR